MQNIADKVVIRKPHRPAMLTLVTVVMMLGVTAASAQKSRSSVSAAEVTGTFRHTYAAKFKGASSDISILALGKGKLRVAFDLIYPMMVDGELSAHMGEGGGTASISGDTAVFESSEFGPCKIVIKFTRPGVIDVTQESSDVDCGFGQNVVATGHYTRVSSRKPKFKD